MHNAIISCYTHKIDPDLAVLDGPYFTSKDSFVQIIPILYDAGTIWHMTKSPWAYIARVYSDHPPGLVDCLIQSVDYCISTGTELVLSRPILSAEPFNRRLGMAPHPILDGFWSAPLSVVASRLKKYRKIKP